jgi:hypothetical protein
MAVRAVGTAEARMAPALPEDEGALRALVAKDVKGMATQAEKGLLRRPETLQRWHDALVALNKDIQAQFTERRAAADLKQQECLGRGRAGKNEWFAFRAQHNAWRAGAIRFKAEVENSLSECKRLMCHFRDARVNEERNGYRRVLRGVRVFLSEEGAVTTEHQGARRELLRLVDGVLLEPAVLQGPVGEDGE